MTEMVAGPEIFQQAVAELKSLHPRPEITLTEMRAPQRLAPWSFALTADAQGPGDEHATARLVLLHDPSGPESWDGVLRLVVYLHVELEHQLASDPVLPGVAWSWLTEALVSSGAECRALGGTIAVTSLDRFGELAGAERTNDLELRGSWTPSARLHEHGQALCSLLSSASGLPPAGVSFLGGPRHDI